MAGRVARRDLFALAGEQRGYFTAAQALEVGYSHQAQAYNVRVGNWLRVDRGIFRLADWVASPNDELVRWVLWSRSRAVVSHESALTVYQIGEFESPHVHLTVPPGFTMTNPALTLHRAQLKPREISDEGGIPITTVRRTIIDIAAGAPDQDQLARLIEEALDRGLVSLGWLRQDAEAIDPRAALYIERAAPSRAS